MFNESIGPINDRLLRLGTLQSPVYLVKGREHMLVGGAGQWVLESLEAQIREFQIDMPRVRYLFIGHSHFDHCGAVPYLQKKYAHLEVLASQGAAKLFAMEKAVRNIQKFSGLAMETMGVPSQIDGIPLAFDGVTLSRTLGDGDRLDLGEGFNFEFYETPGHSRCSMMAHLPDQRWLFPSDSLPIPVKGGEELVCTASESFISYLNSLEKIADLPIELCAWEHFGCMTGELARTIVPRAVAATQAYKQMLKARAQPPGDVETTTQWGADAWQRATDFAFIPRPVIEYIIRTMVQNALSEP
ncbi:MAG: MBL fold metallo-hydrolase [Desulfobacterales bacterium]